MILAIGKIVGFIAEGTLIYVGAKTIINNAIEKVERANDKLLELELNEKRERKEDFMKDYEFIREGIGA